MANIRRNWGYDYFRVDFLRFGINEFIHTAVGKNTVIVPRHRGLTTARSSLDPLPAHWQQFRPAAHAVPIN